jgi:hypothetical protein
MRTFRRRARGSQLVEFALVFPVFLFLFIGIVEYSWFFYQRSVVAEAAREGCEAATQLDPNTEDYVTVAQDTILAELQTRGGIDCAGPWVCNVTLVDLGAATPPRLICDIRINFLSLTGFLGASPTGGGPGGSGSLGDYAVTNWGATADRRLLPSALHSRASSIFDGED